MPADKLPPTTHPSCGTPSGATLHTRRGERACDPCKAAGAERSRRRRADPELAAREREANREAAQKRRATPEGRAEANARAREYNQRPGVTAKKTARHAAWRVQPGNAQRKRQSDKQGREQRKTRSPPQIEADQRRLRPTGLKRCGTCGVNKPLSDFYNHAASVDGLSQACGDCILAKVRASELKRNAQLHTYWADRGIDPDHCVYCETGPAEDLEHVWPRALGGNDDFDNLAPSCIPCNRGPGGKFDLPTLDWLATAHPHRLDAITELFPHIKETA